MTASREDCIAEIRLSCKSVNSDWTIDSKLPCHQHCHFVQTRLAELSERASCQVGRCGTKSPLHPWVGEG